MLHSGSRGVGNRIGTYFIALAKKDMKLHVHDLPDVDLAYLREGTAHFDDYVQAVSWAQRFAMTNRELMMDAVIAAARTEASGLPPFELGETAVNCHHNYVAQEHHFGHDVFVTRKGAVRARRGDLGIIPGSMGARSYIVRGKGEAAVVPLVQPRRRARDVARRGEAPVHGRGSRPGDRGHRVPQGRGRDRRDADGVQADRQGDGGAGRSRRDRARAAAGRLREGLSAR